MADMMTGHPGLLGHVTAMKAGMDMQMKTLQLGSK